MNITIKATGIDHSDELSALVESKLLPLQKVLAEQFDRTLCATEVGQITPRHASGPTWRAEATVRVDGKTYRAEAVTESLESSLDKIESQLNKEIRRAKGRERSLFRRGGRAVKSFFRRSGE